MTEATPLASEQITQDVYPASQEEAQRADGWRFHYGSVCPADCDEVYYMRRGYPGVALGPTPPHLIRWTDTGDSSDIMAWHPVFSGFQRRHRIAALSASPAPSGQGVSGEVPDASREVLTAFAASLDAVPFDTSSCALFSFDTTHGHARVLRRAVRELLDRAAIAQPPYKPFWENPDGPGAA